MYPCLAPLKILSSQKTLRMNKHFHFLFFFLSLWLGFSSCGSDQSANQPITQSTTTDSAFAAFSNRFIEDLWKLYPGWASSQGYHKYDSVLVVPDAAFHQKELVFCQAYLDSLKNFELQKLSSGNKTDHHMLENTLQSIQWHINEFKEFEWNPAYYNVGGTFAEILQGKHAALEEKMRALYLRMAKIPAYYEAAKNTINNPTIEHTELAIQQNKGSLDVFKGMISDSLGKCRMGAHESQMIEARINEAVKAVEGYVDWLKEKRSALKPETAKSFRIGKELYEKKFQFDIQSQFTAEEIYKKAMQRKAELHGEMYRISVQLWNKYMGKKPIPADSLETVRVMINYLSAKHVHRDSFQVAIEKQIPELTKFVSDKNLLYLDPSKPLVVRKEPAYMAGVAGASISSPGPYDKEGNTYYNVGSLAHYSPEEAESYLREYNHYILQILNIHEAIPGHYAQLVYSNQSPSMIKSLFGNGAMVEGWAVYTERMMLENNYGNNEPEMWLMYYKWHLRSVCNTILDYSVHNLGMTKEEAVKFLVEEAFQQKQEAENKWRRVSVTQVQLTSYFTGYTEIYELREEMKKKQGDKFNLKEFHEKFLSYGSAPVKYIRQLMLGE